MGGWRTKGSRKTGFSSCFPLFLPSACLRSSQAVLISRDLRLSAFCVNESPGRNESSSANVLSSGNTDSSFSWSRVFFNDHCVSSDQTTACCSSDIIRVTDVSAYLLEFYPHSSRSPLAKIKWKRRGMKMVDGRTSLINYRL